MNVETEAPSMPSTYSIRTQHWLKWSRLVFCAEWILVIIFAGWLLKAVFVSGWRSLQSEFPDYYLAAALRHHGIPLDRIYEWTWFQRQSDRLGVSDGLVSFAPNPPSSLLPILPLSSLAPLTAKRVWITLNLVFFGASLWMLRSLTRLGWRRLALISLCCVIPLHFTFIYGRYYVLVLLLITGAYYAFVNRYEATSGLLLAAATALKLFPAVSLILLLRRSKWRALIGFVTGTLIFMAVSVLIFGNEVHRVFVHEVLSQIARGDWLAPYYLPRNTYITLWSHLFLREPELNPSPLINSPLLYAVVQAVTTTTLVFAFLFASRKQETRHTTAVYWATLIPLMLLLSPTTGIDHSVLLIFSAIIEFDVLMTLGKPWTAYAFVFLYIATGLPLPDKLSTWLLLRLIAMTLLYLMLLLTMWPDRVSAGRGPWLAASLTCFVALAGLNVYTLRNRQEDFNRRLPAPVGGYLASSPAPVQGGVVFSEMQHNGYAPGIFRNQTVENIPFPGDVLAVAGSNTSPALYAEVTRPRSEIVRIQPDRTDSEIISEGQEPAVSPSGEWIAFVRERKAKRSVWLMSTDVTGSPQMILSDRFYPIDISVSSEADVVAAVGEASDPRLVMVSRRTRDVEVLPGFPHPARYPAISPDGNRVAFSVRERGSWHLAVRSLTTGVEQRLTHSSCNAISPSWKDAQTLLYATDCGRGVGLTAIAWVSVKR